MVVAIFSFILLTVSVAILCRILALLGKLEKTLKSIKNCEILVSGDDMFLIPEKKIEQLYRKYVSRD